ncbi:MFS transporter [Streptomyces purpureus]|uniref:MFS transporter n=1 Tax=Streptomyces purpureus TaxID=1951 RepID=UPI00037BB22A|nr:MFS transporter [Streptomyces purpureus]
MTSTASAGQRSETSPAGSSRGGVRLAVAWATNFMIGLALYMVTPLMPSIGDDYGLTPNGMGLMATSFSVAYFLAALLLGSLAGKIGQRRMLVLAMAVFALANLGTALAPSYTWVVITRVVSGAAAGAASPTLYALTSLMAPPERRARWMAVTVSGLLSALWAGAPIGAALVDHVGWRAIFGAMGVIAAALVLVNLKAWPAVVPAPEGASEGTFAKGFAVVAVSVCGLWAAAVYGLYTFLGVALDQSSMDGATPWLLVCYGVGAIAGIFLGGRWSDTKGAGRTLTAALSGLAVLEFAVAVAFGAETSVGVGLALLVFAFAAFAAFPAQQSRLVLLFPQQVSAVLAWNSAALFLGISVAAGVGGAVISAFSFPWLLAGCGVVGLVAVVVSRIGSARATT